MIPNQIPAMSFSDQSLSKSETVIASPKFGSDLNTINMQSQINNMSGNGIIRIKRLNGGGEHDSS
jgi:hypothetical protein